MTPSRTALRLACLFAVIAAGACTTPPEKCELIARDHGFSRAVLRGTGFDHVVYANDVQRPAGTLHVYIEGDGSPYLGRQIPAPDPTPRRPTMLQLMALDDGPAVYVGRPCYFGLASRPPCTVRDWTLDRFSPRVLESLQAVIEVLRERSGVERVELFGHSGGGTLAVLLARRLSGVERVVTLAGNLDTEAWARLHGYTPLAGSINPVDEGPLPAGIRQLHMVGARDHSVPSSIVVGAARRLGAADVRVLEGVDHTCCWAEHWPAVLAGR